MNRATLFHLLGALAFPAFASVPATATDLPPAAGAVQIDQIDFRGAPDSSVGEITIYSQPANDFTGLTSGFVNVVTSAGAWVVRNLPILSAEVSDSPSFTTRLNLGVADGTNVASMQLRVDYSLHPTTSFSGGPFTTYHVGSVDNAQGGVDGDLVGYQAAPDLTNVTFGPGPTFHIFKKGFANVQTANNQCAPAAVANSLDQIRRMQALPIAQPNVPGLRQAASGDGTLVGDLDFAMNRPNVVSRANGGGVWPLDGKMKFIADNGLRRVLILKHQGDGNTGGVPNIALPLGNLTRHGVTSVGQNSAVVTWDFIATELQRCEDVEIDLLYFLPNGNPSHRHYVQVIGAGMILGLPYIVHVSDHLQTDQDPFDILGTFQVDVDFMLGDFLPISNARVDQAISESKVRVKQAYNGNSKGTVRKFLGYAGLGEDVITAVPGIFCIDPGHAPGKPWANFVSAAQAGVSYTVKDVQLAKQTPELVQCGSMFPAKTVIQHGTPSIRLWWPAMYEPAGTLWALTILYGTPQLFDPDGPDGPDQPSYVHREKWTFPMDTDIANFKKLIELFHELPFGLDEVPLISDEALVDLLLAKLDAIEDFYLAGDTMSAALVLADFELEVMDACIAESPRFPNPTGPGTGIANTLENPACCKLLADAEYLGQLLGFIQTVR